MNDDIELKRKLIDSIQSISSIVEICTNEFESVFINFVLKNRNLINEFIYNEFRLAELENEVRDLAVCKSNQLENISIKPIFSTSFNDETRKFFLENRKSLSELKNWNQLRNQSQFKLYFCELEMLSRMIHCELNNKYKIYEGIYLIATNIAVVYLSGIIIADDFKKKYQEEIEGVDFKNTKQGIIKFLLNVDPVFIDEILKYELMFYLLKENVFGEKIEMVILKEMYFAIWGDANNDIKFEKFLINIKQVSKEKEKLSIDDIDLMSGIEFENIISNLFKKMGYNTKITKSSGDQGIDVIAIKGDVKIGIQTKCYSSKVSNSAIQEVVAGKNYYNLNKLLVVTNNYFTKGAIELAYKNNVILWDRMILKEKISEYAQEKNK